MLTVSERPDTDVHYQPNFAGLTVPASLQIRIAHLVIVLI